MKPQPSDLPLLLKVSEVAELLRTTPNAIYLAAERGQLPGVVRERGRVLFRRDDLLRYVGLLPPAQKKQRA